MWRELVGTHGYEAGTAATVTLPEGAMITYIHAVDTGGGGSIVIFGGDSIPLTAGVPFVYRANHDCMRAKAGALDIVFTGTDAFFVEFVKAGNT